jgi:hypothetical protein
MLLLILGFSFGSKFRLLWRWQGRATGITPGHPGGVLELF